jgi:uncharacterized phage infection (PIP) family protein YhgE
MGQKALTDAQAALGAVVDPEQPSSLTATLASLDETLDDDVADAVSACSGVGAVVEQKDTTELSAIAQAAVDEADAFEAYADAATSRVQGVTTDLQAMGAALADEVVEAQTALQQLATQANQAFEAVLDEADEMVSILAKALESCATDIDEETEGLRDGAITSMETSGDEVVATLGRAASTLAESLDELHDEAVEIYPGLATVSDGILERVRETLVGALETHATLVDDTTAALAASPHPDLDRNLEALEGELGSWTTEVEQAAPFADGVPALSARIVRADAIKVRADAVLNAV